MRSRRPGHALITKQVVYTPHPATEKSKLTPLQKKGIPGRALLA